MIELIQNEDSLIGSKKAIKELEKKPHARILAISDSHGNFDVFMNIIKTYGPECDAFVFCGDGIRDLGVLLETANSEKKIRSMIPPVIAFVRGNCDPSGYCVNFGISAQNKALLKKGFSENTLVLPQRQTLTVNGRKFYIAHGHNECVDWTFNELGLNMQLEKCSDAFYGHTHVAREDREGNYKFVNPGSCSRPRGGQPAGFAIVTVEKDFSDTAFIKIVPPSQSTLNNGFSLWTPIY